MSYEIPDGKKLITPDNSAFEYMGRIDFDDPKRPVLVWPGTMIDVNFTGTYCALVIKNVTRQNSTHFGALVDGIMQKFFLKNNSEELYVLAEGLEDKQHTLKLVKTMASHNYVEFVGIVTDEGAEVSCPNHKYDLKLEVFGDSVSAGEVTEALYNEGNTDPEDHRNKFDNAYFSYPLIAARLLNAAVHDTAQGGIALLDGTGYFESGFLWGMERCYDKIQFSPYYETKQWDFSRYVPDFVVTALGQNDSSPDPDCIHRPDYRRMWKDRYIEILRDLMSKYEGAYFILTLTVLGHDPEWDKALQEIAEEMNDKRVRYFKYTRCGMGTCGHPRATEQAEMAVELTQFIRKLQAER